MRITCWYCRQPCTQELPKGTIFRGIAICPECTEKLYKEKEEEKEEVQELKTKWILDI
jgi:hypothetical protein